MTDNDGTIIADPRKAEMMARYNNMINSLLVILGIFLVVVFLIARVMSNKVAKPIITSANFSGIIDSIKVLVEQI